MILKNNKNKLLKFDLKNLDKNKKRIYCIISYVYILWIVGLLLAKEDDDIKFHVNQGIVLSTFIFFSLFILKILSAILFAIAPILAFITSFLQILLIIISSVFMFIGINNAKNNRKNPLPFIGELFVLF